MSILCIQSQKKLRDRLKQNHILIFKYFLVIFGYMDLGKVRI